MKQFERELELGFDVSAALMKKYFKSGKLTPEEYEKLKKIYEAEFVSKSSSRAKRKCTVGRRPLGSRSSSAMKTKKVMSKKLNRHQKEKS